MKNFHQIKEGQLDRPQRDPHAKSRAAAPNQLHFGNSDQMNVRKINLTSWDKFSTAKVCLVSSDAVGLKEVGLLSGSRKSRSDRVGLKRRTVWSGSDESGEKNPLGQPKIKLLW